MTTKTYVVADFDGKVYEDLQTADFMEAKKRFKTIKIDGLSVSKYAEKVAQLTGKFPMIGLQTR